MTKTISSAICKIILLIVLLGKPLSAYPILFEDTPKSIPQITLINEELICENGCFEEKKDKKIIFGGFLIAAAALILIKKDCCCPPVINPPVVPPNIPNLPPVIKPPDPPNVDVPEPSTMLLFLSGIALLGLRRRKQNDTNL